MRKPRQRKRFLGPPDELNHLNDVVQYHAGRQGLGSLSLAEALRRMRVILDAAGEDNGSIVLQDHWAVYSEATGSFGQAAAHRRREVELVEELLRIGGPITPIDEHFLGKVRHAEADDLARCGLGTTGAPAEWKPIGPQV